MEQRQNTRHNVESPAIMRVQGRAGPFLITILDVSESGLRVSCSSAIPAGSKITIICRGATITGEIRYARNVEQYAFHLGVEADSATAEAMSEGKVDLTILFKIRHLADRS
jgi:hypothetical protein